MTTKKEDIKTILDAYRRQYKDEISSSKQKSYKFKSIYDEFITDRDEIESNASDSFFFFINSLNKMAKNNKFYCGVDINKFAKKLHLLHSGRYPFDISLLPKNEQGVFVMKTKSSNGWIMQPIERDLLSVFTAFVHVYLYSVIFETPSCLEDNQK